jgi:hypothetical protein
MQIRLKLVKTKHQGKGINEFRLDRLLFCLLIIISVNLSAQEVSYKTTMLKLCDALLTTQINDRSNPNYGALVCPSINPDRNPLHSRAAEAVYPLAIAYKLTNKAKYRDAAIILGNWLIRIQDSTGKKGGGWSEIWPDPEQKGWYGTTVDQLLSMAGAYSLLKPFLKPKEIEQWNRSMQNAAQYVMLNFPIRSNINYNATAAATLLFIHDILKDVKESWLAKADSLMNNYTLNNITSHSMLSGEGQGVDEGYDIAQSIGYIALYAILKKDNRIKQIAADLLREHFYFVYPNGSIDNSWGTRTFKWTYESGTKTAPGAYFSFALLADMDPRFETAGHQCLEYLNNKCMQNGWIIYGPHSENHESTFPPCNYQTFARSQSLALAIEYGAKAIDKKPFPAQELNWYKYFPDVNVVVVRTGKIMATVSAYDGIARYPRPSVSRGGSITNLWYDGFGENGFLETSSTALYERIEPMHMPIENKLLPLTPRIEYNGDTSYFSNLFESKAKINVFKEADNIKVVATGKMRTISGISSNVDYSIINSFFDTYIIKEITVEGESHVFRIIEPIVKDKGTNFSIKNDSTIVIKTATSEAEWEFRVISSTVPYKLSLGKEFERYWCPFPSVESYPIMISFNTNSKTAQTVKIFLGKK